MGDASRSWWKVALIGCGAVVGLGVMGLASMVGLMAWSSRAVLRDFDALASRTTPGAPLAALLDNPFVHDCAEVSVSGPFEDRAEYPGDKSLRQAILRRLEADPGAKAGKGTLALMWIHAPPFGRVFLQVDFDDGKVTSARTSSLD